MNIAVCPGSFDPLTNGHIDIACRAAKLFDKVVILVLQNPAKHSTFTVEERVAMISECIEGFENITVDSYGGLLSEYVKSIGAAAIVKGLRAVTDFEYEFQMALTNKQLYPGAETVFLTTSLGNLYLSSSLVRELASFGGDITKFVPERILQRVVERLAPKTPKSPE